MNARVRVAIFGALFLVGCGGDARPTTTAVTGRVLLDGVGIEGAIVTFNGKSRPATGTTDAEGKFTLTTFAEGDGAIPGDYTVTVVKQEATASNTGAELTAIEESKGQVPPQYASVNTSKLNVTVEDGGENDFDLTLEK